jgi:hypothetical protein
VIDVKSWALQAERIHEDDEYDYADFAADLVDQLGRTRALDVATALRSYVYGQPGSSDLHKAIEPLYRRLGWQQSALVACWFRDARNRPGARPQERPSGRRPGGWPASALPTARTVETQETP